MWVVTHNVTPYGNAYSSGENLDFHQQLYTRTKWKDGDVMKGVECYAVTAVKDTQHGWREFDLGCYKTDAEAKAALEGLFCAIEAGKTLYRMP